MSVVQGRGLKICGRARALLKNPEGHLWYHLLLLREHTTLLKISGGSPLVPSTFASLCKHDGASLTVGRVTFGTALPFVVSETLGLS